MSKKCIKCGQPSFGQRFFLSSLYSSPEGKTGDKSTETMEKGGFWSSCCGSASGSCWSSFSLHHRPKSYEGGAQVVYTDKGKSYKMLLNFSEDDGVTGHAQGERTDTLAQGMESALPCQLYVLDQETGELAWEEFTEKVVSC